jgi:hypothetical protein
VRFGRRLRQIVLERSSQGRAAEIVGWSNAAAAGAGGIAIGYRTGTPLGGLVAFAVAFAGLRLMLAHRKTVGFAALLGTSAVAGAAGSVTWLFAHVVDRAGFADALGIMGALVGGAVSAWAYADLAGKRHAKVPDSLVASAVPSSSER